jgi:hypothetical protein
MSHTRQDATNYQSLLKRSSPSSVVERHDAERWRHLSDRVATQKLSPFLMCNMLRIQSKRSCAMLLRRLSILQ